MLVKRSRELHCNFYLQKKVINSISTIAKRLTGFTVHSACVLLRYTHSHTCCSWYDDGESPNAVARPQKITHAHICVFDSNGTTSPLDCRLASPLFHNRHVCFVVYCMLGALLCRCSFACITLLAIPHPPRHPHRHRRYPF